MGNGGAMPPRLADRDIRLRLPVPGPGVAGAPDQRGDLVGVDGFRGSTVVGHHPDQREEIRWNFNGGTGFVANATGTNRGFRRRHAKPIHRPP